MAENQTRGGVPAVLNGKPVAIVLFNNLGSIPVDDISLPAREDERAALALELIESCARAPAGWKGDDIREKQVLNALFPTLVARSDGHTGHI